MKRSIALATLAFGLAAAPVALAQDDRFLDPDMQTGTRFKQAPETAQHAEARAMQKEIARCVFYRNQDEVRELLAHSDFFRIDFDAIDRDPETWFDDFDISDCMGRAMKQSQYKLHMRLPYATMRNLLAEEAYLKDHKVAPALAIGAEESLDRPFGREMLNPRTAAMIQVADCIAFKGTREAHDFLSTRPGTKSESEAFVALAPTLGACMKQEGEISVQRSLVRQLVADGMWARATYGAGPATEGAEAASAQIEAGE